MSSQNEPLRDSPLAPFQRTLSEQALEALARRVVDRIALSTRQPNTCRDLAQPGEMEIARLTNALLDSGDSRASEYVHSLQFEGLPLEILYARYLAPAAAKLGEMWDHDRISFLQVTLGITRVFSLMRMLRMNLPAPRITQREPILFASVPGEQHTMGVEMAVELFRQRGWDTKMLVGASEEEILAEIRDLGCLILGLSAAGRKTAEAMAHLTFMVRATHPEIHIILSGKIVDKEPDLVSLIHADSIVGSVEDALATMKRLTAGEASPT